jgi:glutamate N-acetyltransferase/amino-acid N-acetyltransferase
VRKSYPPQLLREVEGGVTAPCGFDAAGVRAGLKERGLDVALVYSVAPAAAAGVFTANRVQAAPVLVSKDRVGRANVHGVVINSGSANACTGDRGYRDAVKMAALAAQALGVPERSILVCSTGVIGRPLPMRKIATGVKEAVASLRPDGGEQAAEAILTTDTRAKTASAEFELDGRPVRIGGMAKGAGMIAPNLATMLAVITTDARLSPALLQSCLAAAVDRSFNRITVDGDTSTNDCVLAFANRQAEAGEITPRHGLVRFQTALDQVCAKLSQAIVADGEGATKTVEVCVRGAQTEREALQIARTIATSPLVKAAIAGGDPNWGRVLAAAGRAGVRFRPELVELYLGKVRVVRNGAVSRYTQQAAERAVAGPAVSITLDLGAGEKEATVWTCDLTGEYVRINSAYHT